ncbi:MAG TPA: hypothetical protein VKQ54_07865 [Caulobacteraceae bacterium]|nr:hypothetical protein [Caulobacteraceae bacterium]
MLKTLLNRMIGRMERQWRYDASYMRFVTDVSPWTSLKFSVVTRLVSRRDAPAEALAAAGLAATLAEDCGPCTQIGLDMAAAAGVSPAVLRAVLAGDRAGMGEPAALAYDFARAVLAHDLEADALREEIVKRWGEKALVALAMAITTARMYPTLKYGLGYGKACTRLTVAGAAAPVARPVAQSPLVGAA